MRPPKRPTPIIIYSIIIELPTPMGGTTHGLRVYTGHHHLQHLHHNQRPQPQIVQQLRQTGLTQIQAMHGKAPKQTAKHQGTRILYIKCLKSATQRSPAPSSDDGVPRRSRPNIPFIKIRYQRIGGRACKESMVVMLCECTSHTSAGFKLIIN